MNQLHHFCNECTTPVVKSDYHIKKHINSKVCKSNKFEALKLDDVIPGKGRSRYTNFILYLAGYEELMAKSKHELDQEKEDLKRQECEVTIHEEANSVEVNIDQDKEYQNSILKPADRESSKNRVSFLPEVQVRVPNNSDEDTSNQPFGGTV